MDIESDYDWYVQTDLSAFSGKWVAILNKQVVASNANAKLLAQEVKEKYPKDAPLVARITNGVLIL